MRNQINPVTWGKVPGDELDPVRILFNMPFWNTDVFLIVPDTFAAVFSVVSLK